VEFEWLVGEMGGLVTAGGALEGVLVTEESSLVGVASADEVCVGESICICVCLCGELSSGLIASGSEVLPLLSVWQSSASFADFSCCSVLCDSVITLCRQNIRGVCACDTFI